MTLVVSLATSNGVWQAADRRYSGGPIPKFLLATKLCRLNASDAIGVMTYSGLGVVYEVGKKPFELSEWISNTLRGRKGTINELLSCLCLAANERRIAARAPFGAHTFQWAGFVDGKPMVYLIGPNATFISKDLVTGKCQTINPDGSGFHMVCQTATETGPVVALAGSGAKYVSLEDLKIAQQLASEAHKSPGHAQKVSEHLAKIIRTASAEESNNTVSPESIVCFSHPEGCTFQAYDSDGNKCQTGAIPTIMGGYPVGDIANALMPLFREAAQEFRKALDEGREPPKIDTDAMEEALKDVRTDPDDLLPETK